MNQNKFKKITTDYLNWKYKVMRDIFKKEKINNLDFLKAYKNIYVLKNIEIAPWFLNIHKAHYELAASIIKLNPLKREFIENNLIIFLLVVMLFFENVIKNFYLILLKTESILRGILLELRRKRNLSKFCGFNSKILEETIYRDSDKWKFNEVTLYKLVSLYESIEFNGELKKQKTSLLLNSIRNFEESINGLGTKSHPIDDRDIENIPCLLKKLNEYRNIFFYQDKTQFDTHFFYKYFYWLKVHENIIDNNSTKTAMLEFLNVETSSNIANLFFKKMSEPIFLDKQLIISDNQKLVKSTETLIRDVSQTKKLQSYWNNIKSISNQTGEFGYIRDIISQIESKVRDIVLFLREVKKIKINSTTLSGLINYLTQEINDSSELRVVSLESIFLMEQIEAVFKKDKIFVIASNPEKLFKKLKLTIKHLKSIRNVKNSFHHFEPLSNNEYALLIGALDFFDSTKSTSEYLINEINSIRTQIKETNKLIAKAPLKLSTRFCTELTFDK